LKQKNKASEELATDATVVEEYAKYLEFNIEKEEAKK
jgi:hypothetical protein